jgi:ABC-type nickel/cobalt efflux system permease component RcnA
MTETELIDFIHRYFASERQTALINASLGAALILAAAVLSRWSAKESFQKGLAYPLTIAGVLLSLACGGYLLLTDQRSTSIISSYQHLPMPKATAQETARLNKVVSHSYTGAFWICGALIAAGVVMLLLTTRSALRRGIACGLVMVGLLVIASELYSKQKNTRYFHELQTDAKRR